MKIEVINNFYSKEDGKNYFKGNIEDVEDKRAEMLFENKLAKKYVPVKAPKVEKVEEEEKVVEEKVPAKHFNFKK